jgi:hypothetical protein
MDIRYLIFAGTGKGRQAGVTASSPVTTNPPSRKSTALITARYWDTLILVSFFI